MSGLGQFFLIKIMNHTYPFTGDKGTSPFFRYFRILITLHPPSTPVFLRPSIPIYVSFGLTQVVVPNKQMFTVTKGGVSL